MSIDLVNILLILGIGQSLFLTIGLTWSRNKQQPAATLLALLLLAFAWYQVEFFLLRNTLDTSFPWVYSTRFGSWLLVGPLLLLYNRATLIQRYTLQPRDAWHFLPFIVFTVVLPLTLDGLLTQRATHYGMLTVLDSYNQEVITWRHYLYVVVFALQFAHAGVYIYCANIETRRIEEEAKNERASLHQAHIGRLRFLYSIGLVMLLLCSLFVIYLFCTTIWRRHLDYLYVLPFFILIYGLAYRAMHPLQPLVASQEKQNKSSTKYERSGLSQEAKEAHLLALDHQMRVERIYRDNDLRLGQLAKILGTTSHHLSQILNEEMDQNFFDFINSARIREAQELIRKMQDVGTLTQIGYQVGFNNKNSFASAFKKHAGMTPSAFRKIVRDRSQ